jgi:isopentenyl-diphosphate delta-isomerase
MLEEHVILVDAHDNPVGTAEKLEAHQKGLLHRAVSVVVLNTNDRSLLLQRRALDKYHCGGLWTNTACSHPRPGETTQHAAERRLQEEMGLQLALEPLFQFTYRAEFDNGLTEHEYDHVFVGYTTHSPQLNAQEAMDSRWVSRQELKADVAKHPEHYTPWFRLLLPQLEVYLPQ